MQTQSRGLLQAPQMRHWPVSTRLRCPCWALTWLGWLRIVPAVQLHMKLPAWMPCTSASPGAMSGICLAGIHVTALAGLPWSSFLCFSPRPALPGAPEARSGRFKANDTRCRVVAVLVGSLTCGADAEALAEGDWKGKPELQWEAPGSGPTMPAGVAVKAIATVSTPVRGSLVQLERCPIRGKLGLGLWARPVEVLC